jgi:EmrB/QacA subfamily drug resistance transporter
MSHSILSHRSRWLALMILCFGELMIVLDTTIVNVALPSIKTQLQFTETSLVWVVNAYMLTFSGFLLLGGRLGDLYGHRRIFLIGIAFFTLASLVCGLAQNQTALIVARALQGLGGAVVSAVALSLIMNLFTENTERAKAMGVYGFVMASGGSVGVLLGGVLTDLLSWHWIFLVNIPVGLLVLALSWFYLPAGESSQTDRSLDWGGAITVTLALMLAVYAIVNGNALGWLSTPILILFLLATIAFILFIVFEMNVRAPLIPLAIFRQRNIAVANVVGVLWAAGMFAWFFIAALYLQLVLNYTPMQVGLAFLPSNVIMAGFSLGLSALLIARYGLRWPLSIGLLLIAIGLLVFAFAPASGNGLSHVLPGMILLGLGAGMALNPLLMVAMNDVEPSESGLASGLVNTAFMMGGSLGLAILASLADVRTRALLADHAAPVAALNSGYQLAFFIGALFTLIAAAVSALFLRGKMTTTLSVAH